MREQINCQFRGLPSSMQKKGVWGAFGGSHAHHPSTDTTKTAAFAPTVEVSYSQSPPARLKPLTQKTPQKPEKIVTSHRQSMPALPENIHGKAPMQLQANRISKNKAQLAEEKKIQQQKKRDARFLPTPSSASSSESSVEESEQEAEEENRPTRFTLLKPPPKILRRQSKGAAAKANLNKYTMQQYLPGVQIGFGAGTGAEDSSYNESDISELMNYLNEEKTGKNPREFKTIAEEEKARKQKLRDRANNSFTEIGYVQKPSMTDRFNSSDKRAKIGHLSATGQQVPAEAVQASDLGQTIDSAGRRSQFMDFQVSLVRKINLFEIKVHQQQSFPIKVFDSSFLSDAASHISQPKKVRRSLKRILRNTEMRKAYLYLFWIVFAMKFKEKSFARLDHFAAQEDLVQTLRLDGPLQLFNLQEQDLRYGHAKRVDCIKYWRFKFQNHFYEVRRTMEAYFTKRVQDALPFVVGKAIELAFERQIRFGGESIRFKDPQCAQVYQVVFMELVGFKVDKVYITRYLKRHLDASVNLDPEVLDYLENRAEYIKQKAVSQYRKSKNPIEKLEYQLNQMIGPKKLKEGVKRAQDQAIPTEDQLEALLEADVFQSKISEEVCLFPKPQTKFERIAQQTKIENTIKQATSRLVTQRSSATLTDSKISSARVSPDRMVIMREGGRHQAREKVMVLESDRTSPMLRSIQSQTAFESQSKVMKMRGSVQVKGSSKGALSRNHNNTYQSHSNVNLQELSRIEQCSNPAFVPINKSSRELKLIYSEYKQDTKSSQMLRAQIESALRKHDAEKAKAQRTILERSKGETSESMRTTMSLTAKKHAEAVQIHDDINRDCHKIKHKKKFLNWDPMKIIQGQEVDPNSIVENSKKYQKIIKLRDELNHLPKSPVDPSYNDGTPLFTNKIRPRQTYEDEREKRQEKRFFDQIEREQQFKDEMESIHKNSPVHKKTTNSMLPKLAVPVRAASLAKTRSEAAIQIKLAQGAIRQGGHQIDAMRLDEAETKAYLRPLKPHEKDFIPRANAYTNSFENKRSAFINKIKSRKDDLMIRRKYGMPSPSQIATMP